MLLNPHIALSVGNKLNLTLPSFNFDIPLEEAKPTKSVIMELPKRKEKPQTNPLF